MNSAKSYIRRTYGAFTASAADIEVRQTELRILVAPLSSAHRTRVLATLCGELNATATPFPGTNLILRYEVGEIGKR